MKIVLYGATGNIGRRILAELLSRGHKVTAVLRDPAKLTEANANLTKKQGSLESIEAIASDMTGADAVVSAYAPPADNTDKLLDVVKNLTAAAKKTGVRLLIVGGAASLEVAPGVTVLDAGHLPAEWLPIATAHARALEYLRTINDANWTYFSPAALIEPGPRSSNFRLGKDKLIVNDAGESRISMEDYAVALADELEDPEHEGERFTIGY